METLLIIENNYMMRLFLINFFNQDFDVQAVETPAEALEKIKRSEKPAFVISDFYAKDSLERKDFVELLEVLEWQKIPNMVLTDKDKSDERIESLKLGAKDVLSKPFNPSEMKLRVYGPLGYSIQDKAQKVA